ncbi:MAG: hypothetical protein RIQ52_203, partial [Pseudomonadota bacterium]
MSVSPQRRKSRLKSFFGGVVYVFHPRTMREKGAAWT